MILPTLYNLIYKEGDTPTFTIDAADLAVPNLNGWQALAQIRKTEDKNDFIGTITCLIVPNTKLIEIYPPGDIPFTHHPSEIPQTLRKPGKDGFAKIHRMERGSIPGKKKPYFWDLQLKTPADDINTFIEGAVIVLREATLNA
jgi:hypothetical protein